MKIGIMADSHDNISAITKSVSVFNDLEVSLVLHAGDLISPFVSKPLQHLKADFIAVFGNNDGERLGLSKTFEGKIHRPPYSIEYAGKKILLLHEPDIIDVLEKSDIFDIVVYGHLHEVDIRKGKTLIINPGECGGWLYGRRTVAVWDTQSNDVEILPV